jgi:cysteine desulfurase
MVYLDHAATTPLAPEVLDAMLLYLRGGYGNPSSLYQLGRQARKAIEDVREQVAAWIGARPAEIVFTSGGSESDTYAICGMAAARRERGRRILTTPIEHHAVLHACGHLAREGFQIDCLPVDAEGRVAPEAVAEAIGDDTILVSVMQANNEIGTIQPIAEIGAVCAERGVPLHCDAVQGFAAERLDVRAAGVGLLAASAHKFYGPKGVGVCYLRTGWRPWPLVHGGSQERGRRAGTENVAGIVGLGAALELAAQRLEADRAHETALRERLIEGLLTIPGCRLNGPRRGRLANNVNVCFEGLMGESLLILLDGQGICASSGSACASGSTDPSHVLLALGLSPETAHGSLRLTVGRDNTAAQIEEVLAALAAGVERLQALAPPKSPRAA